MITLAFVGWLAVIGWFFALFFAVNLIQYRQERDKYRTQWLAEMRKAAMLNQQLHGK